ncbi:CBS domain-containing protein [Pseudonocardia zijingensis]|uniref:CBS domain-containing protein n=1 Tax=Pseudonocardia zijingensis TaxID=153376 RepID=A0ABN1QBS4_9PSEU
MTTSTVANLMIRRVLTTRPAMPLEELAGVLTEHGLIALPVLDPADRLVGVVSERDLFSKPARPLPGRRRWWQHHRVHEETRRAEGDTVGRVMTGTVEQPSTAEIGVRLVNRLNVVDVASALEYRLDDGGTGGRARSAAHRTTTARSNR